MKNKTRKHKHHKKSYWDAEPSSVEDEAYDSSNGIHHGDVKAKRHKIDDKPFRQGIGPLAD